MTESGLYQGLGVKERVPVDHCREAVFLPSATDSDYVFSRRWSTSDQIVVRPIGAHYEILCGADALIEIRKQKPLSTIKVTVANLTDEQAAYLIYTDRVKKNHVIARAKYYQLIAASFDWSPRKIGEALGGIGRTTVYQRMQLLNLDPQVIDHLSNGELDLTCGKYLLSVKEPSMQRKLARKAILGAWTSKRLYKTIHPNFEAQSVSEVGDAIKKEVRSDLYLDQVTSMLTAGLQSKIKITGNKRTNYKGSIIIDTFNSDVLAGLVEQIYQKAKRPEQYKGQLVIQVNNLDHLNCIVDDLAGINEF